MTSVAITRMARYFVRRWFRRSDETMVEDCVSAGLEAICKYGADHPRIRWESVTP